jgi:hypothetical protein
MGSEHSKSDKFADFKVDLDDFEGGKAVQHQTFGSVKLYTNKKNSEEVMVKEVLIPEDNDMFQKYVEKMQRVVKITHPALLKIIGKPFQQLEP